MTTVILYTFAIGSSLGEYRHILSFIFAINDINNDPNILPNITLGYHIYDSCGHVNKVIKDVLQIMSGHSVTAPNYSCMEHGTVAGFIGDLQSVTTLPMAKFLGIYGYTQVSYGARDPALSDRRLYPHFFRTVQNNEEQYVALVKFLIYFKWNMVCIFTTNDDIGERDLRLLTAELQKSGICIELVWVFTHNKFIEFSVMNNLKAEVVILCGANSGLAKNIIGHSVQSIRDKTFIFMTSWTNDHDLIGSPAFGMPVNCSFMISPIAYEIFGFEEKFLSVHPSTHPHDPILEDIWITSFYCLSQNALKNSLLQATISKPLHNCSGKERFTKRTRYIEDGFPYNVLKAVRMMAQTLHHMHKALLMSKLNKKINKNNVYRKKVRHFMKLGCIQLPERTEIKCFNNKGELSEPLVISNVISKENMDLVIYVLNTRHIGTFDGSSQDWHLNMTPSPIVWINNKVPKSQCSEQCSPGYRKVVKEGAHICCYDCILCSEGKMSNVSDADNCKKCFSTEWPNETRDKCIPKMMDFLSYETDVVAYVFLLFSTLSSIVIVLIIGIFIYFRNTPVVRANNRNLSFIMLVSLKLSFLCIFLYIGKPEDTTCMFRHISFGIIFTVVLSSILAKTIMVCIAFKATTPGSYWRQWIGVRLPNAIVLVFSSLQVLNGIFWLSFSPPFQEEDMDSYPGKIIIECNEGSRLAFYCMFGYMGFLAGVSFVLAFMVRTLPDMYNEAKYITFSMLVFCSVWICAIPAYLSSKGKNMVSVEVFAILASGSFTIMEPQ
ncbi:vomeronasal type-2 receptor 26-like [Hyla sarda]|uniref:vomeronasal type-2 receptor 26-like n=1 Tax=Hyla sarda TaxID=327740 RepID=UPI0024C3FB62|nr:vomeronasal type-2 receptor 26-like [Hyla sarda]